MNNNWRQLDTRIYAVLASLLISAFTLAFPDSPNDDAYTYIKTAEIFLSDGLSAAYQHYEWASYSIMIGLLGLTGIDLFTAGLVINSLLYGILVYSFLSIIKEIDDSKALLVMASITILVYPQLNEYRYLIIRDVGFWAFSVLALWQYLNFARSHSLISAFAFSCSLLLAAIFRAEAMAYLLLTPFALLFDPRYERSTCTRLFLRLGGTALASIVVGLIFFAILGLNIPDLFVEFISVYQSFIGSAFSPDEARSTELGRVLFSEHAAAYSQEYITVFLVAGFLTILLANLFNAIGGPYLIVLLLGFFRKHVQLRREILLPIIAYLLVNAVILFSFLFITRFLTSRYAMLFCILLVIFVPLIMLKILNQATGSKQKSTRLLIAIFFTYCTFDSYLSFGESKDYVFDSIEWLAENTDEASGLITNNHAIAYFTGKVDRYDIAPKYLSREQILATNEGDTIAVELNYQMEQLLINPSVRPYLEFVAGFPQQQEQRVALYRRVNP